MKTVTTTPQLLHSTTESNSHLFDDWFDPIETGIRLVNDLPPNRDVLPSNHSRPHHFNSTKFHFHGAHCSPSGIADNVMRSMVPGKSYDI